MTRLLLISFLVIPFFSFAQEESKKLKIDTRKQLRIDYRAPSWNKSNDKIDSSALIIRDSNSGRLVKIEVTETAAESGQFVGLYQINFEQSGANSDFVPEVYVVPPSMLKSDQQLARIQTLIDNGTLLRKPFFLRTEQGSQLISVYDSKTQALSAYRDFVKSASGKPLVDQAALEAKRLAEKQAAEKALALKAAQEEAARRRLEEDEKARKEELIRQQAALDSAERARRQKQAQQIAAAALQDYQGSKFIEAETKFNQAIELDPSNKSYFFQYGVSLYRNEKFNKAIVILDMAEGPTVNIGERDYYRALSYMKLKDYDGAHKIFSAIQDKGDPTLAPSAAFFAGVIDFQKENYDPAKARFEYVLDKSSDPKMDEQAEMYIEQIANIKMFEEMRKKKLIITANIGLIYDSNILATNAANAPTDLAGYRWSYGTVLEYRPVFSEHHEFSGILSLSDMYSTDKSFAAKTEFQNTDPLAMNLSFPYKWKGVLMGKPAQVGVAPAYETVLLNADGTGAREAIVASMIVKTDGTFVMNEDHFANYALELRSDTSKVTSTDDDNQSGTKMTLSTTQTFFQDKKKTRAWIGEGSYAMNTAKGKNQSFNRIDLAGSYLMPAFWETTMVTRLGFGQVAYPTHSTGRSDTAPSLTLVFQKPLTEKWSLATSLAYNKNTSTIESSTYDKTTLSVTGTWKDAF